MRKLYKSKEVNLKKIHNIYKRRTNSIFKESNFMSSRIFLESPKRYQRICSYLAFPEKKIV